MKASSERYTNKELLKMMINESQADYTHALADTSVELSSVQTP
jgi:hypothetical protein